MTHPSYDSRLDALLQSAAEVFAKKGFHYTTMRNLANATGMSLAGMYHYVKGKDELLFLIQTRCFARVLEGAMLAIAGSHDPEERLHRFIQHHVTFFANHMAEMKVLSHEAGSLSAERVAGVNDLKRRYLHLLVQLIHAVRQDTEIDARVAAYALFGMMNWVYNWYDPNGTVSPRELADQFSHLIMHGLTASSPTTATSGG